MILFLEITGQTQTGKTTIALGALERLHRQGVPVVYVLPTFDWARDARRRTEVTCLHWRAAVEAPRPEWRAVAVEDDGVLPLEQWWDGLGRLRDALSARPGAAQLIVVGDRPRPPAPPTAPPPAC